MGRKISERELEDWICKHCDDELGDYYLPPLGTLIGRQVQVEHGIIDLLSVSMGTTQVIELKKGALKEADVGQVLRYSWDVKWMLKCLAHHYSPFEIAPIPAYFTKQLTELASQFFLYFHCQEKPGVVTESQICSYTGYESIQPVLVGRFANLKVLSAAEAANVKVYTWEYLEKDNAFLFKRQHGQEHYYRISRFPDWAISLTRRIWKDSIGEAELLYRSYNQDSIST